jgi:hypothetical protein
MKIVTFYEFMQLFKFEIGKDQFNIHLDDIQKHQKIIYL